MLAYSSIYLREKLLKGSNVSKRVISEEIEKRIEDLKKNLLKNRIDACIIIEKVDFYYYTGTTVEGLLFVEPERGPLLMIRKPRGRAELESPLSAISYFDRTKEISKLISKHTSTSIKTLGLELDVLPFSLYKRISELFQEAKIVDISPLIKEQRAVKSKYELSNMKRAFEIIRETFDYGRNVLKPGMTEIEFSALLEGKARSLGHQGIVRMRRFNQEASFGHVVFGKNNNIPCTMESANGGLGPYPAIGQGAGFTRIEKNRPILVDVLSGYNGYLIDITRVFVIGRLEKKLQKAFFASLELLEEIRGLLKPGMDCRDIYQKSISMIKEMGYQDRFMGPKNNQVEFLGHGIGLELDEIPVLAEDFSYSLRENNTIAVEPKIFFPGKGMVGIENTYVVTKRGGKPLTDYPETLIQI